MNHGAAGSKVVRSGTGSSTYDQSVTSDCGNQMIIAVGIQGADTASCYFINHSFIERHKGFLVEGHSQIINTHELFIKWKKK